MLLAEIVFAARLLGLVSGKQEIAVNVDASVTRVAVQRDGEPVATLTAPPWRTTVDLGAGLAPHELTVIAYDANGAEVGRDSQALNVPRPPAELGILLDRDAAQKLRATIRWSHFAYEDPAKMTVKLDGRVLDRKQKPATMFKLGAVDMTQVHALGVEATFPDGVQARKEIVFGGYYSEQMPAELTPIAVRQRQTIPDAPVSCFRAGDRTIPNAPIESGPGSAIFIINGGGAWLRDIQLPKKRSDDGFAIPNAEIRIMNPVPAIVQRTGGATGVFDSNGVDGAVGTRRLMFLARTPAGGARIADAAGAAALRVLRGGQRRVMVIVLGDSPARDLSTHTPAAIRAYLQRIGVPLRVWSLSGPRPDLADSWGEVRAISTVEELQAATEDLRRELDSQRLAWLPVPPLEAFRVIAEGDCAYEPLAGKGSI